MVKWIAAVVGVIAIVAVTTGTWWWVSRGDAPEEVSLAAAVAGLSTPTPASTSAPAAGSTMATATTTAPAEVTTAAPAAAPETLDGTWVVVPADSFLGYRIDEELRLIGATTAVGRTSDIEGTLEFDGNAITAVSVVADVRTLRSDDSRRDGQLRTQALESNAFPEATFVLAEPIAIEGDPTAGAEIEAVAVGDLTIHGVTQRVQMPLQGRYLDGQVVVVGSTVILLADYDIDAPRAASVLSVSEEATIELQLVFRKA